MGGFIDVNVMSAHPHQKKDRKGWLLNTLITTLFYIFSSGCRGGSQVTWYTATEFAFRRDLFGSCLKTKVNGELF